MQVLQNAMLSGPLTITLWTPAYGPAAAISYYYSDDVVQFPTDGLTTKTGQLAQVNVEASGDLANWVSSAAFPVFDGSNTVYRLRIVR